MSAFDALDEPRVPLDATVFVCDARLPRRVRTCALVRRVVRDCREITGAGDIRRPRDGATAMLALVALDGPLDEHSDSVDCIRRFAAERIKVIAYDDSLGMLPIGMKCLPLIAGATEVLDGSATNFEARLIRLIQAIVRDESTRESDRKHFGELMRRLGIVGESPALLALCRTVLRISRLSDLPVLLTGETGTGKERFARAIHQLDPKRRHRRFVPINCGAISPAIAESELFGHTRGAFTSADRERAGLIRSADGGVLFLDELSELEPALQTKLLRVIQEGRVLRVGEDREEEVSVRIVAATNKDLRVLVARQQFRADLFHRLNVLPLHIPPLRERPADIRPLVEHFVAKHHAGLPELVPEVESGFIEALMHIELPGNARQVENLVRRVLAEKDEGAPFTLSTLPQEVWRELAGQRDSPATGTAPLALGERRPLPPEPADENDWNLDHYLAYCEKHLIETVLAHAHGNRSQTARLLGVTARSVYNKVRKHQLL